MPPPPSPMGDNYLSIVFPHPEWGGDMQDYGSDFHHAPADRIKGENWNFEVRTQTPGIPAELSWQGPTAILAQSRLKDAESGKILVDNCARVRSYDLILDKQGNKFVWEFHGQSR